MPCDPARGADVDAPTADDALATLAAEQERATAAELMAEMAGYVDAGTAALFMRDSGALPPD